MTDNLVELARKNANRYGYYSEDWTKLADHIEKLEASEDEWNRICNNYAARIDKLESALIDILKVPRSEAAWGIALIIAREALEKKDD